jgi:NADP-dependent 3-hydroxy acid dehydrogenase YdfG
MSSTRKTWFITGASSGFGHAFATYALQMGYNVVATARNPAKLKELVAQAPDRVLALSLDVDRPRDAETAVAAAVKRFEHSWKPTCAGGRWVWGEGVDCRTR